MNGKGGKKKKTKETNEINVCFIFLPFSLLQVLSLQNSTKKSRKSGIPQQPIETVKITAPELNAPKTAQLQRSSTVNVLNIAAGNFSTCFDIFDI
jgi:hypothetical protein